MNVLLLLSGVILTLCGYYGPQDGGMLELCGLALIVLAAFRAS